MKASTRCPNADSYLNNNSTDNGNYNNYVNISGEFWNAELVGLGETYLYGFNYTDDGEESLALLGTFTLSPGRDRRLAYDRLHAGPGAPPQCCSSDPGSWGLFWHPPQEKLNHVN